MGCASCGVLYLVRDIIKEICLKSVGKSQPIHDFGRHTDVTEMWYRHSVPPTSRHQRGCQVMIVCAAALVRLDKAADEVEAEAEALQRRSSHPARVTPSVASARPLP
jgi:hypothetical protein